ncbi:MAG: riboflavin synthase [Burkholderiales bacterium]
MFTGIVMAVGRVLEAAPSAGGIKLAIDAGGLPLDDVIIGDSIAVNGACLTVISRTDRAFEVDVSRETLECVAGFEASAPVNLEKALRLSDRLGGHLVSGHVDGIGTVERVAPLDDNRLLEISVPDALARYVARKGSVAVNGVSVTVNEVRGSSFTLNLIPHTIANTNLETLAAGSRVNIEIDLVARYVERLFSAPPRA